MDTDKPECKEPNKEGKIMFWWFFAFMALAFVGAIIANIMGW